MGLACPVAGPVAVRHQVPDEDRVLVTDRAYDILEKTG
jgi:hypothetical protein